MCLWARAPARPDMRCQLSTLALSAGGGQHSDQWSLTTITCVRCWSACTVIDKWATAEHGPPITISRCRIATLLQSPLLAVLPYRMGQVSGLATRPAGCQAEAIRAEQVGSRRHYKLCGCSGETKYYLYASQTLQVVTSCYTRIVELHELLAARHGTARYLRPQGVSGLGPSRPWA